MKLTIYQVDAFSDRVFGGNPAAVVVTKAPLSESLMQAVAAENNLAETAFVFTDGEEYRIRWFTPTTEVGLCGHATLAAAHVFFEHLVYALKRITFDSKSGLLHVRQSNGLLWLDLPADTLRSVPSDQRITEALGQKPLELYRGRDDYMALFADEADIAALKPDMRLLAQLDARGVIVTAHGRESDFVSRFFAPQAGIPEDAVTGSAHTTLTPYWAKRLKKPELTARQLSLRGGALTCRDHGERVELGGTAATYMIGTLFL